MEGQGRRDLPLGKGGSRKRQFVWGTMNNRKKIVPFLRKHKHKFLAGLLLTAICILLFGIFSQFQAPTVDAVPSGETSINYSTLLHQVEANNVLAVFIQGNDVNALLQQPLHGHTTSHENAGQREADITAWMHNIGSSDATWDTPSGVATDRQVYTILPASGSGQLLPLLIDRHIPVETQPAASLMPGWVSLFLKFAPLFFFLLLVFMVFSQRQRMRLPHNMQDQMSRFMKRRSWRSGNANSPADLPSAVSQKKTTPGKAPRNAFKPSGSAQPAPPVNLAPPTTFADVAGIDEVRVELEEIVQFLRAPEKFDRLGARIPRGALLVGPPGTGKTLLARAVAGEAGVPFFSLSASEFVEMFVGVGASRVRDLFQQARQVAPAVIFIDEVDAVGKKRSVKAMGSEERDQTLNQLLVEMDGFHASQAVVVLAATNRADTLDKALLRPGRFDRRITVSLPDRVGRQAILQIHTRNTPLREEVSLERLARMTTGMSGADLANLVNEAALCAARKDLEHVDNACFEDALARVQLGALRPLVMSETDRRIIAYHEGGHALVAHYLKDADTVNCVTILPRGQSLGVTQFIAEEDRYNYSREMLMAKIAVGLGGRVAEELMLGRERVTTGAENDFQVVTGMARRMVTHWGMSDTVGVVFAGYDETGAGLNMRALDPSTLAPSTRTLALDARGRLVPNGDYQYRFALPAPAVGSATSPDLASTVDREIKKILDEGHEMARNILHEHIDQLQRLADALMEHEQLKRAEFEELLRTA